MGSFRQNNDGTLRPTLNVGAIGFTAAKEIIRQRRKYEGLQSQYKTLQKQSSALESAKAKGQRILNMAQKDLMKHVYTGPAPLNNIHLYYTPQNIINFAVTRAAENKIPAELLMSSGKFISLERLESLVGRVRRIKIKLDKVTTKIKEVRSSMKEVRSAMKVLRKTAVTEIMFRVGEKAFKVGAAETAKNLWRATAKHHVRSVAKQAAKAKGKMQVGGTANIVSKLNVSTSLDSSNFDRKLNEYMKYTKKSLVEVVNEKAYRIVRDAIYQTYRAEAATIRAELEAPSEIIGLSVAEAIALKALRSDGVRNPKRSEVKAEARRIIARRTRAVGFLRSGWLPALRILAQRVPWASATSGGAKQRGQDKGGAVPASEFSSLLSTEATIYNSIEAGGKAPAYLLAGLQIAMNREAASMQSYIQRKLDQAAMRFNIQK